jgi:DNA repair photolyase
MRWDAQRVGRPDPEPILPGMPPLEGLVRSIRPPDFAGVTFHEVLAKSALNKVPGASAMPFGWTVNPYRGCTHACAYCLDPDTWILMADSRMRPLADIRSGDLVMGTVVRGRYRRYVPSRVLATWSTRKPAYRVTLADGTELIASGDHRFLTERGWKHVTGAMSGAGQRPYLTTNNKLVGFGFPASVVEAELDSTAYQRGYLAGMIRGDANLAVYRDSRRSAGVHYRFRLALADDEALARAEHFLKLHGVETRRFRFAVSTALRREIWSIRSSSREAYEAITDLVAWQADPSEQWSLGYLAGLFDAEGSNFGAIRISNTDRRILGELADALDRFGFEWVEEPSGDPARAVVVRVRGGLPARNRFFALTRPAITRKSSLIDAAVKSGARLQVAAIEPLAGHRDLIDISTETGDFIANGVVSHNCFARNTHTYLDLDAGHDFDSQIVVKTNVGQVLRRELARPNWRREHVALGTNTDPYQRAEGRYALMPEIIDALTDSGTPFSILTKGTVLSRDLDRLALAAAKGPVGIGISLALLDPELQATLEPGTPSPKSRLGLIRKIRAAGLPCGVFVAPLLPHLTDSLEQLTELFGVLADAGATGVSGIPLHLRPGAKEWFLRWLSLQRADLVPVYQRLYRRSAYLPSDYRDIVSDRIREARRTVGLGGFGAAIRGRGEVRGVPGDPAASFPDGSLPTSQAHGAPRDARASEQLRLI